MRALGHIAALLFAAGCATTSGSTNEGPRPSLAVLPVESDVSPKLVSALNDALQAVKIEGNLEIRRLKVPMQVVQMQIECIEITDACFTAVGKSLNVDGFLTATLSKDKAKGYRVTLVLFNVDKGTTIKVVDKSFKKEDEAVRSAYELVDEVLKRKADAAEASH
jgi:hypothetical protein